MERFIVGIDFGTTNSAIAVAKAKEIAIIPNNYQRITPSIVAFTDDEVLVGVPAKNQFLLNPDRTIVSVKRYMGSDYTISVNGRTYLPQQIAALIINKLKKDAEDYLGCRVEEAIISVPAYYNEAQRMATIEAGLICGLKVERLITEPAAAALSYGFVNVPKDTILLVYDFGGGTFDVTVMRVFGNYYRVLSAAGDGYLGGDDIDTILIEYLKSKIEELVGDCNFENPLLKQKLKETAENAKIELSDRKSTDIIIPFIETNKKEPVHLNINLKREEFENMILPLISRTVPLIHKAIKEAGLTKKDIDHVILSGGSTRIPSVRKLIQENIGILPERNINPDECVAIGAAILGGIKSHVIKRTIVRDVLPLSLGTDIDDDKLDIILKANTPIPARKTKIYTTTEDNQDTISIKVYQGENKVASRNHLLAEYEFNGIPPMPAGVPEIEITFKVDVNGILNIRAYEKNSNNEISYTVPFSRKLSNRQVIEFSKELQVLMQ